MERLPISTALDAMVTVSSRGIPLAMPEEASEIRVMQMISTANMPTRAMFERVMRAELPPMSATLLSR